MKINGINKSSIAKINGINITSISKMIGVVLSTPIPTGLVTSGLSFYVNAADPVSYTGGGEWIDISGSGIIGQLMNGASYDADGGGSITFDGSSTFVLFEDDPSISITGDITMNCWVKVTDFGRYNGIVSKVNYNIPNPFDFYTAAGSGTSVITRGDGINNLPTDWMYSVSSSPIATNTWQNITITCQGGNIKFYINSVSNGTDYISPAISDNGGQMRIGNRQDFGTPFLGNIAILQLYNRALTDAEVLQNFSFLSTRFLPTPSNSFDAGDTSSYPGSGSTWYNKTGASSATLYNGVSYDTDGGGSLVFDGSSNYAVVPYDSTFDFSTGNYTMNTWVKFNGRPSTAVITSKDTYGANFDWCIYLPDSNNIYNYSNGTSTSVSASVGGPVDFNSGQWYLITISSISGYNSIYVNGVQYGSSTYMSTSNSNTTALTIGSGEWNYPGLFLNGKIAVIEYYNVGLTDDQTMMYFNKTRTRFGL